MGSSVEQKVKEIICEQLGVSEEEVTPQASFIEDLGEDLLDVGTAGPASVDYPDYARAVAERVSRGEAARGILVCTSGVGMSIAANKFPGVRAALVADAIAARMAREHNDANVLVFGGGMTGTFD